MGVLAVCKGSIIENVLFKKKNHNDFGILL